MADITINSDNGRRSRSLPRVDLTPMVDLGFILITFFMYTTSLMESKAMDMNLPMPASSNQEIPMESTVTLVLSDNHRVVWYEGIADDASDLKVLQIVQLRQFLQQKQAEVKQLPASFSKEAHQLHVVIKPDADSKYTDLVTVLDEMLINAVPYYVLQDLSDDDKRLLAR